MKVKVTILSEAYELVIPEGDLAGMTEAERVHYVNARVCEDAQNNVSFRWEPAEQD